MPREPTRASSTRRVRRRQISATARHGLDPAKAAAARRPTTIPMIPRPNSTMLYPLCLALLPVSAPPPSPGNLTPKPGPNRVIRDPRLACSPNPTLIYESTISPFPIQTRRRTPRCEIRSRPSPSRHQRRRTRYPVWGRSTCRRSVPLANIRRLSVTTQRPRRMSTALIQYAVLSRTWRPIEPRGRVSGALGNPYRTSVLRLTVVRLQRFMVVGILSPDDEDFFIFFPFWWRDLLCFYLHETSGDFAYSELRTLHYPAHWFTCYL